MLFAAVVVVAVGASVEVVCGDAVAEGSGAGALALCPSPVLVDCWPSAVEPPLPVEPSEGAVDGDGGEPLSPAVAKAVADLVKSDRYNKMLGTWKLENDRY